MGGEIWEQSENGILRRDERWNGRRRLSDMRRCPFQLHYLLQPILFLVSTRKLGALGRI